MSPREEKEYLQRVLNTKRCPSSKSVRCPRIIDSLLKCKWLPKFFCWGWEEMGNGLSRLFPENLHVSGMLTAPPPPGSWAARLSSGSIGKVQTALWVPQAQRSLRAETVAPAPARYAVGTQRECAEPGCQATRGHTPATRQVCSRETQTWTIRKGRDLAAIGPHAGEWGQGALEGWES